MLFIQFPSSGNSSYSALIFFSLLKSFLKVNNELVEHARTITSFWSRDVKLWSQVCDVQINKSLWWTLDEAAVAVEE